MNDKSVKKHILSKYRSDIATLAGYMPSKQITLAELNSGVRRITLASGLEHEIDDSEASRLLSEVPYYFWDLMKIPIIFYYIRWNDGSVSYRVQGDVWQRRLVEILLTGDYSSTGISEITSEEFRKLLKSYKSLIFVSIGGNI